MTNEELVLSYYFSHTTKEERKQWEAIEPNTSIREHAAIFAVIRECSKRANQPPLEMSELLERRRHDTTRIRFVGPWT